jgi:hypothetical protein
LTKNVWLLHSLSIAIRNEFLAIEKKKPREGGSEREYIYKPRTWAG